jgi:ferrous iron transport protein A
MKDGECKVSKLSDLKPGETGVIKTIQLEGAVRARMMQLGLTEGEAITVEKFAPLGDPIEVSVRGYSLCFRKSEADKIILM